MASAKIDTSASNASQVVGLEEAIALLETGQAGDELCVDFGHGLVGRAEGAHELDGLLQRARGLRLLSLMARREKVERPAHMRSVKPALHPSVKEILDALKRAG